MVGCCFFFFVDCVYCGGDGGDEVGIENGSTGFLWGKVMGACMGFDAVVVIGVGVVGKM